MSSRKECKAAGRKSLKRHYGLFVVACLIASLLGVEFGGALTGFTLTMPQQVTDVVESGKSEVGFNLYNVLDVLIADGSETGQTETEQGQEQGTGDGGMFGRRRGVLAQVVNLMSNGTVLVLAWSALRSVFNSESAAVLLFVLLNTAVALFLRFFVLNVYTAISRRIFLEGRMYSKVPLRRFWFFLRVKKWMKVALTLFLTEVFQMLWSLTIVGGIIKYYSYFMVPYIAAENPDISPLKAIRLSRAMMKGHKWECFVMDISFLGWSLLGGLTMGLSDILYTNPYRMAAFSEYYTAMRTRAKETDLPDSGLLNDVYLFEKAPQELLDNAYGEAAQMAQMPEVVKPTGVLGFFSNVFGVILVDSPEERAYEESLERQAKYAKEMSALRGETYPSRLYPIGERDRRMSLERLHYMRHYSIWSLILLFFNFALVGWLWEVGLGLITNGELVNRGVLHGPWLPIYGTGCVLILVVLNKFRSNPLLEFVSAVVLCGVVEYFTAMFLELTHDGLKWWDYSGYFLNIHGRVCAEGLLVFGVGGIAVVYALAPLLDNLFRKIPRKVVIPVCLALLLAFAVDQVYSGKHPNVGRGVTDIGGNTACIAEQMEEERTAWYTY